MNIQDMTLGAIANTDSDKYPYSVMLHCIVNDALIMPEHIRHQNPNQIAFALRDDLKQGVEYDYETRCLTFYTTFGGVPATIVVPAVNIAAVTDDHGDVVSFGKISSEPQLAVEQQKPATPETKPETKLSPKKVKPLYTLKHLSLVVDNT